MSKYYDMIEQMSMPEGQREKLKTELMEWAEKRTNVRPVWKRYAVAAALALCFLVTAATTYAAVHYQEFRMFFDNGTKEDGLLEELAAKASTEEVTAENENYKFTVLSHLYSREQQMGMIICSFQFLTEQDHGLAVNDVLKDEAVVLRKDLVGSTEKLENTVGLLNFQIWKAGDGRQISANSIYFANETAEDGGYLIGIRYHIVGMEGQEPGLVLSLEQTYDTDSDRLRADLPESEDVETVRFASERNPQDNIVISPIGMSLTITGDKDREPYQYPENSFVFDVLENIKFVMGDSVKTLKDTGNGMASSSLASETDTTYTWYVQKEFLNLEDVSKIEYIELDGATYRR